MSRVISTQPLSGLPGCRPASGPVGGDIKGAAAVAPAKNPRKMQACSLLLLLLSSPSGLLLLLRPPPPPASSSSRPWRGQDQRERRTAAEGHATNTPPTRAPSQSAHFGARTPSATWVRPVPDRGRRGTISSRGELAWGTWYCNNFILLRCPF